MDTPVVLVLPDLAAHAAIRAALAFYIAGNQGEPAYRRTEIHDIACGLDEEAPGEVISLDEAALKALAAVIAKPSRELAERESALETALTGVANLLANWESGDLAGAVNDLRLWADETLIAWPDLEAERWIAAEHIRPGDRVDLDGVLSADSDFAAAAEMEYARVMEVECESETCVRLDFENFPSVGFDPTRPLKAICTAKDRAAYADDADPPDMTRWTAEKVARELAFRDDNGGDPDALAWIAAVEAEATRRGLPFTPHPPA